MRLGPAGAHRVPGGDEAPHGGAFLTLLLFCLCAFFSPSWYAALSGQKGEPSPPARPCSLARPGRRPGPRGSGACRGRGGRKPPEAGARAALPARRRGRTPSRRAPPLVCCRSNDIAPGPGRASSRGRAGARDWPPRVVPALGGSPPLASGSSEFPEREGRRRGRGGSGGSGRADAPFRRAALQVAGGRAGGAVTSHHRAAPAGSACGPRGPQQPSCGTSGPRTPPREAFLGLPACGCRGPQEQPTWRPLHFTVWPHVKFTAAGQSTAEALRVC